MLGVVPFALRKGGPCEPLAALMAMPDLVSVLVGGTANVAVLQSNPALRELAVDSLPANADLRCDLPVSQGWIAM